MNMTDFLPQSWCQYRVSPFFNDRPQACPIELVVIHNISLPAGCFSGDYVDQLFLGCWDEHLPQQLQELQGVEVSAHIFIRRDGSVIQYVPFSKRAWHAGVSRWQGRDNCNDFSIGIELEGTDEIPYEEVQYEVLIKICDWLRKTFPTITDFTGHSHIAPNRKTDPGKAFDWNKFERMMELNS
ncbi:1,6-anhydro-N-acetylmuramyl-L-alanine amidase AmpD [Paraferrimonas sp. SM1919]|uniref:1,6-anhydro-N-acetylmuramyl-L-alanine amidase AmpD n=1 Tax=Paraferrimonas sp. SM1919 TaxID=2662263 RepID=UPI00196A06AD|nr:1,6-anhydro-N-acetylmuramyl-L-alanine amidase AmpD [Paraferrimonas sp. SM1919]